MSTCHNCRKHDIATTECPFECKPGEVVFDDGDCCGSYSPLTYAELAAAKRDVWGKMICAHKCTFPEGKGNCTLPCEYNGCRQDDGGSCPPCSFDACPLMKEEVNP